MCRLFGLLGDAKASGQPWLTGTRRSLLAQAHASDEQAQRDGWGIAWYETRRLPRVEKGTRGAFEPGERERFVETAEAAHGPVVIGHLRHASNPLGLPHAQLIGPENSQPFTSESVLFAHNGEVCLPRETRPELERYESSLRGVNDSEVLFWLFLKHFRATGEPVLAYQRTRERLLAVWERTARRTPQPYTGLNVLFSPGPGELWAFCHWRGEHGGGLLAPDQPYYRMGYFAQAGRVVVGSEPFDDDGSDWKPIENGGYLSGHLRDGELEVRTGSIG